MDLKQFKNPLIHSAVIVLHELSTDSLILTKRSEGLRHHPGEISFPGGLREHGDTDLYVTALRELKEELGISEARVTLVRKMQTEITALGTIIHPWFATIVSVQPFILNPDEVSSIVSIPMHLVQNPKNYKEIFIQRNGKEFKTFEFGPQEEYIWGATARIMRQLVIPVQK